MQHHLRHIIAKIFANFPFIAKMNTSTSPSSAQCSPSPAPRTRALGCFGSVRRREQSNDTRVTKSLSQLTDDYLLMKQQVIGRPSLTAELAERHLLLTERDLRTDFASGEKKCKELLWKSAKYSIDS